MSACPLFLSCQECQPALSLGRAAQPVEGEAGAAALGVGVEAKKMETQDRVVAVNFMADAFFGSDKVKRNNCSDFSRVV